MTRFCQWFKITSLIALTKAISVIGSVSGFSFAPGPVIDRYSKVATKRDHS